MPCSCLHTENRSPGIFDKLIKNDFIVIILFALKLSERANADNIAVTSHHGNGFKNVFGFVAIHDHAALRFELPCTLIDVENDYVHAQIQSCFLGTQTCSET
ncbi:MAG: hypothetical protein BWZ06_01402 [Bacteroidetes bacterium ADurb.BinA261]|nr:MAG: hypothetical protein BWZ06_01402 [Bacteroidetes bacterium ADurb.BinA261]